MNLIFLFSASLSLSHETPPDRISISAVIPDGEWLSETHSLPEGDLILLTMPFPHGVLSMISHTDYIIYVGLTPIAGGLIQWFKAPESDSGLFNFGTNTAIIEIVATKTTSLTYAAYYIGSGDHHCTSVRPASSEIVFEDFRNSSSRSCFVVTDMGIECSLIGDIGRGKVIIRRKELFDQFMPELSIIDNFYAIQFSNEGVIGSTLNFTFEGADRQRDYDEVTQKSPTGSIGKGIVVQFEPLTREPIYPGGRGFASLGVWIGCLMVLVSIPLSVGYVKARFFTKSAKSESPIEQLFDSQAQIEEASPPVSVDVEEDDRPIEITIPESPYNEDSPFL
jgi:hypothetical protein